MYHFGLVGYPLSHSLSPRLQTAAMNALGLPGEYTLFPLEPDGDFDAGMLELLEQLPKNRLHGLNITIPHKQSVMPLLDNLTPEARAIGAVNTIIFRGGQLIGANTDAPGFLVDLYHWKEDLSQNPDKRALLLGAGGSARAVAYALTKDGWRVTLAARRLEQAEGLAKQLNGFNPAYPVEAIMLNLVSLAAYSKTNVAAQQGAQGKGVSAGSSAHAHLSLLVNTTPLGMAPNPESCAWPGELPFPADTLVYDLVYNPPCTALLLRAKQQGLSVRNGTGMLVEQAALALEMWTGFTVLREPMLQAVAEFILS